MTATVIRAPMLGVRCVPCLRYSAEPFDQRHVSAHGYAVCDARDADGHGADPEHPADPPPAPFIPIREDGR